MAVKIFNVARHDKNEILTQVFRSKAILVGSSTMNNVMMPKIAGMLEEITGLRFRNKQAAAFGSYGWNGGAVDRIQTRLMDAGFSTSLSLKSTISTSGLSVRAVLIIGRTASASGVVMTSLAVSLVGVLQALLLDFEILSQDCECHF